MMTGTKASSGRRGALAAVCRDRREAARAAAALRRAGVDPRRISFVANELPRRDAPSWVTLGCLNAIGSGLEGLGLPRAELDRCRRALRDEGMLVIVQGTPEPPP